MNRNKNELIREKRNFIEFQFTIYNLQQEANKSNILGEKRGTSSKKF